MTNTQAGHNKEYRLQITDSGDGTYAVDGFNCAIGGNPKRQPQGSGFTLPEAEKALATKVNVQTRKGYVIDSTSNASIATLVKDRTDTGMRAQLLNEITRDEARRLFNDPAWGMQIKEDGDRLMVRSLNGILTAANRVGIETNLTSELADALRALPGDFEIDGEYVEGIYHVFDILKLGDASQVEREYDDRDKLLSLFLGNAPANAKHAKLYRYAREKEIAFMEAEDLDREGVVFKRLASKARPGRPNSGGDHLKCKFWAELSALVAAHNSIDSIALDLFDENGLRVSVGNVKATNKPAIGKVVDIRYLYMKKRGGSLFEPVFKRERTDVDPLDCTTAQIRYRSNTALSA